ncbi:F-box only protein 7 isoform X1 [Salvelinus namaycush]|uniref:F-box only protein 7 isoform X1 n=1 Tax=Salvelinus namaycush TaxID=8040 RepID=A0A8U0U4W1_SALNM|nr:F-box only protein 7 isoform X1 [Salvelinus namaycush]
MIKACNKFNKRQQLNMKLRVRINKQTSRVKLEGEEPTLTELNVQIREILLPSHGLSPDTEFTLSLNGADLLSDSGQTLSSCGIVTGDLVCVILPPSVAVPSAASAPCAGPAPSARQAVPSGSPASSAAFAASARQAPSNSSSSSSTGLYQVVHPPAQCSSEASSTSKGAEPQQEVVREEEQEGEAGRWVWEPMLCGEAEGGKVPHSLEVLYHQAQSSSTCDALMVAVHLLMVETGFLCQGSEGRPGEMPAGWRAPGGLYRLQYAHPLCDDSLAMVLAVPMGPVLVINATLKTNQQVETVRKLSLKPSTYVTDQWTGDSAAAVYTELRKLSRVFKDQLVYPLIASAREAMALPAVFGLPVLPPELLLRVLRLLDVSSLLALSSVNRHLHQTTADPALWRHLYRRDFRDCQDHSRARDTQWRELYKKKYKWRREAASYPRHTPRYHPVPPPIYPLHPLPNNPFPFYPPGIIGGEYDQRPGIPGGILPRPRYDPIGPLPGHDPTAGGLIGRRGLRPTGNRPADIRRGFI